MVEIELSCGASVTVDENALLNDYELFEDVMAFSENRDISAMFRIQRSLLDAEQLKAVKDAIRGDDGKVSTMAMATAIAEIIKGGAPKKS